MNKLNVQQTGGFPMETDTLEFTQAAYTIFNALGELAGPLSIVSGCEKVGSQVTNGTVYINGELLEFRGAAVGTNVIIRQENTQRTFEDGNLKDVYQTRYACFGSGTNMYKWADFKRISNLQELKKASVPIGAIMMWGGAINTIPARWHLCDGTNGTPDLRSRFIVGYNPTDQDYSNIGKIGGSKSIITSGIVGYSRASTYIPNQSWECPTQTPQTSFTKGTKGTLLVASGKTENREALESIAQTTSGKIINNSSHTHSFTGHTKDNRPPYYALAFIQFKGD